MQGQCRVPTRSAPLNTIVAVGASLLLVAAAVTTPLADDRVLEVPPHAAAVGFTVRTFSSTFTPDQLDLANSSKPGFKWYPFRFFGGHADLTRLSPNTDGSVTLLGDTTGPNGELATASWTGTPGGFVGTAFGGGGYFEATFKFDPQDVIRNEFHGWPAWWSMAIEHMADFDTQQWPGQPKDFHHFIEADFFEYDLSGNVEAGKLNTFGGALHDWFGVAGEAYREIGLPVRAFTREVPAETDFRLYHRYGFLWVPATATRDGYAEHYFDGRRVGRRLAWKAYANQAPPPQPPWVFSIIDRNHLVLILGTGPNEPMTIQSVNVWQASDAQNIKR